MMLKVTLASNSEGWDKMMNGQLETELARSDRVEVSGFVPCNSQKQREHARALNIKLYDAMPGLSGFTSSTELLSFPPDELEIDILIMHSYGRDVGRQAQVISKAKQCKMVFVLHTVSEELERFMKSPASSTVAQQSEHDLQVTLCEKADLMIAVGPKVAEAYKAALQFCGKQEKVITLMPKLPEEFGVRQQRNDSGNQNADKKFRVLISASSKYFEVKGCDIAAKAFKLLDDPLYHLILVIQPKDDITAIQQAMVAEGITLNQLTVRKWSEDPAIWRRWLCEADVVIKPSRTEGFGMSGLKAIAAGLPVLISQNCGLGMALKKLTTGAQHVVDSNLPQAWADKIKEVKQKGANTRCLQAEQLRNEYSEKFSWNDQINELIEEFFKMVRPERSAAGYESVDGGPCREELKFSIQETKHDKK